VDVDAGTIPKDEFLNVTPLPVLWPASQNIYATTKPPSLRLFSSLGATDRLKARSTASSSSSAPCTAAPASIYCAYASSTLHKTQPPHTTRTPAGHFTKCEEEPSFGPT
jgi:hypothetical protein